MTQESVESPIKKKMKVPPLGTFVRACDFDTHFKEQFPDFWESIDAGIIDDCIIDEYDQSATYIEGHTIEEPTNRTDLELWVVPYVEFEMPITEMVLMPEVGQQITTPEEVNKFKMFLTMHLNNSYYLENCNKEAVTEWELCTRLTLPWTVHRYYRELNMLFVTEEQVKNIHKRRIELAERGELDEDE